ncbi:hypothetical protein L210DRAFT_527603 [Boletus edulis BED1]|uniref:Uncharacterized protein n=1 Tax=Boletus edulis BED1 TaxID=1328754 RepID=A0AAD4BMT2_BOLED|nr:hypothetical protein L210DRAFT_527603 [Boletus edulis BED1]
MPGFRRVAERFGYSNAIFSTFIKRPTGIFPGIVIYLSCFFPWKRLQIRIAAFYVSSSLSGVFSGLLAAVIDQINGRSGKPGWPGYPFWKVYLPLSLV